jgi:predicted ester cyclase
MGLPATGRSINVLAVDLVHFEDGKAAERWGGLDMFSLMKQLGVIPQREHASS